MKTNILALVSKYRTALMGFAALWILADHEWLSVLGPSILGKAERFVAEMGYFGVDIFLMLSGMGLVYAIEKYSVKDFYKRRFTRILVPFVITVCACALARGWEFTFFLKSLVGYNFWMVNMYTVLWFLFAVMTLYVVFPLYYSLFRRANNKYLFTGLVLLVWFAASNLLHGILRFDLYGFTNRIPVFLTGVLAGWLLKEGKAITVSSLGWMLCVLGLLAGAVCHFLVYKGVFLLVPSSECFLPSYLVAVFGSCLLAQALSLADRWAAGKGLVKILAFFGSISLELYCIQEIVLGRIVKLMEGRFPNAVIDVVNYAVITLGAYLLHRFCTWLHKTLKIR